MSKLSIIIPVYFNENNLLPMYEELKSELLDKLEEYELIFVDDCSGDNSLDVIKRIKKIDSNVKFAKLSKNFGSHAAIYAGLNLCTGDCAIIKAADMQEPSSLIHDMFMSWKQGNKVVLAIRDQRDDGILSNLFSDIYYFLVRKLALKNMPKKGFDIYLIDRKVINVLKLLDEKNSALTMQILCCGFKTAEVHYKRKRREIGKSKWTLYKKLKLVVDSIVGFSFIPIRVMSVVGVASFFFSILWLLWVMVSKMFGNIPIQGYTTLMITVLFFSGCIMLTLGILGEYVWRTLSSSRNRPVYIIEEESDDSF